jgi:predicted membrane protein
MKDEDHNDWQILFPNNLATALNLTIGAGEASVDLSESKVRSLVVDAGAGEFNINLANTSLSSLEVNAGVGELNLDLSGKQEQNLDVEINGGIGSIKLVLPQETGVRVKVSGLGGIDVSDLIKRDGYYVNTLYGKTAKNMEIEVNGGLGSLELRLQ